METNVNNVLEALLKIAKANHYLVSFPAGMKVSYDTFSEVQGKLIDMENSGKIKGKYAETCFVVLKLLENIYTDHSLKAESVDTAKLDTRIPEHETKQA